MKPSAAPRSRRLAGPTKVALRLETADTSPPTSRWLAPRLRELARLAGAPPGSITVVLVDASEMARLHRHYSGKPGPTDVLTFVDGDEADVALCVDEARRRSEELGHELRRELLLYALHGMLHAAGMDDRTPEDFARMHAEEDRLLAAVGLQPTFEPGKGAA